MATVYVNAYQSYDALGRALERKAEFERHRIFYSLIYSALDTRLCIERTLFEYFVIINNKELSRKMEKLYRATDLKREILQEEPEFFRKLEFIRLLAPFCGINEPIVPPDLELLSSSYGLIGGYLHAPKRPQVWGDREWWLRLKLALNETLAHLVQIHMGHMGKIDLNAAGRDLFARFSSGELSSDDLVREFEKTSTVKTRRPKP